MLTRLKVQGFKNLLDVEVRFGPFTCITGKNAVGKSNLFDAIHFLHLLTRNSIMEAAQKLREAKGRSPEPASLFTSFGDFRAPKIRFEADLIIDRSAEDKFGVEAEASISSVRYALALRLAEGERPERLELLHESLEPRTLDSSRKELGFPASKEFKTTAVQGRRTASFISTLQEPEGPRIKVHQEGHGGRSREVPALQSSRTVLGGLDESDFPTILAVHREMESWKTLMLEPSAMRAPSDYRDPHWIDARGAHLPATVERLERKGTPGEVQAELANRLAELIEDVRGLRVRDDPATETLTVEVQGRDGVYHPARSLSDGTLRFLVLATLGLDPDTRGLISLEEPENGLHPKRIPAMLDLLRDIAVDPSLAVGTDNPLRQVLVNTHSPVVVRNVDRHDLIYLEEQLELRDRSRGRVARITAPKGAWRTGESSSTPVTAPGELEPYDPQLPLELAALPG